MKLECIGCWSQTRDGQPSTGQTIVKVNGQLGSLSYYLRPDHHIIVLAASAENLYDYFS
jgi:hypothetical protein